MIRCLASRWRMPTVALRGPTSAVRIRKCSGASNESMVAEAVRSLKLKAELIEGSGGSEVGKMKLWRVEADFGLFVMMLQDSHLLKLQAAFKRPEKWSVPQTLVFANIENRDRRYTKCFLDEEADLVLVDNVDLKHIRPSSLVDFFERFRVSMLSFSTKISSESSE